MLHRRELRIDFLLAPSPINPSQGWAGDWVSIFDCFVANLAHSLNCKNRNRSILCQVESHSTKRDKKSSRKFLIDTLENVILPRINRFANGVSKDPYQVASGVIGLFLWLSKYLMCFLKSVTVFLMLMNHTGIDFAVRIIKSGSLEVL